MVCLYVTLSFKKLAHWQKWLLAEKWLQHKRWPNHTTDCFRTLFEHQRAICLGVQVIYASRPSTEYFIRNTGTGSDGRSCHFTSLGDWTIKFKFSIPVITIFSNERPVTHSYSVHPKLFTYFRNNVCHRRKPAKSYLFRNTNRQMQQVTRSEGTRYMFTHFKYFITASVATFLLGVRYIVYF